MADLPRFTIVTSSFNQGRFIARTVESVLAQDYPNFEHIVVDGMSSDETPEVLARYPHLRLIREPDRGQAEAINKGFRHATGDIYCFLNSDDTLLPGALRRVARAIDPAAGRHVVVGRCLFIDEHDRPTGREHPCAYHGQRRLLETWKSNTIPQPATFWAAEVWRRCGPLDEKEHLVLDYDLFCRFSRHSPFHVLDDLLATYRLHPSSKSCINSQRAVYKQALRVSWRHWPGPANLEFWRLLGSFLHHRRQRASTRCTALGWELFQRGQSVRGLAATLAGAGLAPGLALGRLVSQRLSPRSERWGAHRADGEQAWSNPALAHGTLSWRCFTGAHADGRVGPVFRTTVEVQPGQRTVRIEAASPLACGPSLPPPEVFLNGAAANVVALYRPQAFTLEIDVRHLPAGQYELEARSPRFIVPHDFLGNRDERPVSFHLLSLTGADTPGAAEAPVVPLARMALRAVGKTVRASLKGAYRFVGRPISPRLGLLWQYPARPLRSPVSVASADLPSPLPLISIVTPSYNQGLFLERTLRSVLDQGWPRLQYIVQDGGSTDQTRTVLERYGPRLARWESARDRGQADALKQGLRHATGDILAYLNSDDLLLPGALAYAVKFFHDRPEVDVLYGHRIIIDEHDREVGRWVMPPHDEDVLLWADYVPQETLFWRRRIWERVGAHLDESLQFALDWDLLLRFRDAGAVFARVPRFLGAFRVHAQQKTSASIHDVGSREMDRLRRRYHGRSVTPYEVARHVRPYLRAHLVHHALWRLGLAG